MTVRGVRPCIFFLLSPWGNGRSEDDSLASLALVGFDRAKAVFVGRLAGLMKRRRASTGGRTAATNGIAIA